MLRVSCLGCGAATYTDNNSDPDSALVCPDDAVCKAEGAAVNGAGRHPIHIEVAPNSVVMQHVGSGS